MEERGETVVISRRSLLAASVSVPFAPTVEADTWDGTIVANVNMSTGKITSAGILRGGKWEAMPGFHAFADMTRRRPT